MSVQAVPSNNSKKNFKKPVRGGSPHRNQLHELAVGTLRSSVTPEIIYASTAKGSEGMYHALFGRDTCITFLLLLDAYKNGAKIDESLWQDSISGFLRLATLQATIDDVDKGGQVGQIIHEYRTQDYEHLAQKGWPIYDDGTLRSYDTYDATSLFCIAMGRLNQFAPEIVAKYHSHLVLAYEWIIRNMSENYGWPGYHYNPDRKYKGLFNWGWKDSEVPYLFADGSKPVHPLNPVEGAISTWAALRYGEDLFKKPNLAYAKKLRRLADNMKKRFNSKDPGGFLMEPESGQYYFAEAIAKHPKSGKREQLPAIAVDPLLAFFFYYQSSKGVRTTIVKRKYRKSLVEYGMKELWMPDFGLCTYSNNGVVYDPVGYHRGPSTSWAHIGFMVACGLDKFGFKNEAYAIGESTLMAIAEFNSCIELYRKDDTGKKVRWEFNGQKSAADQTWCAAGLLAYLTRTKNKKHFKI